MDRDLARRIKRRRLLALAATGGLIIALVISLRFPRFELYTTELLDINGKTVRMQVLAPAGWPGEAGFAVGGKEPDGSRRYVNLRMVPPGKLRWAPGWFRSVLGGNPDPEDQLHIKYERDSTGDEETIRKIVFQPRGYNVYVAERRPRGYPRFAVVYSRANKAEFEATYRQVCKSFKVLEQPR